MSSHNSWRTISKCVFVLSMVAIAMSFSACAKGFKLKDDEKKVAPNPASIVPTMTTASTYYPLLELAAEKSAEIKAMVADPANKNRIQVDGQISFAFTNLVPNQPISAETSVLYFDLTVTSPGKQVSVRLESNVASLNITAVNSSDVKISGYWTINRPTALPLYVGIDSQIKIVGTNLMIEGGLYANFNQNNEGEQLSQINLPLCTVLTETEWLKTIYGDYVEPSSCTILTY